ncbi:MAG: peptide MFS transporter [Sandaracinus sp.]
MSAEAASSGNVVDSPVTPFEKRVGHHPALFALFFAEMWERFSYYGMRALLVFYMTRGFLHYDDNRSYGVYGAYTALVYMTPFIGGLIADKLLGQRAAVVLGGSLMALGHLVMTVENDWAFYSALALLICGNGFFKPNIGTILGSLYGVPRLEHKRDGAFTIFYMGVNLGAAMAPLLCGYVGETYGWHYGFGLATIGMMIGLAIFVAPTIVTQVLIGLGALGSALALVYTGLAQPGIALAFNVFVAISLVVAMIFALWALANGALPAEAGQAKNNTPLNQKLLVVFVVVLVVPAFAWLCRNPDVAGYILYVVGAVALGYVLFEAFRVSKIERERLFVILIMCVFSMLFWAFFEQAGSSINNFTDRNVDRVSEARHITEADVGHDVDLVLNQEQLGYPDGSAGATGAFTLDRLSAARGAAQAAGSSEAHATWHITREHVGMGVGGSEVPASIFQATNPIFILLFGLVFTALWTWLGARNIEPSTPTKFVFALAQLGGGFLVLWIGGEGATERGMVGMTWLVLAYLLHTTGELCLSPVGLSMVSKLSPARMVATMMGAWYLATAFSQFFAGLIAMLTGVSGEESEGPQVIPPPAETLHLYSDVFVKIAIASFAAAVILAILTPFVKKWMHEGENAPSSS